MSLHGEVKINGRVLMQWSARRITGTPEPDSVNRYHCDVVTGLGTAELHVEQFTVEHRYGDGAAALAATVLARIVGPGKVANGG